MACAGRRIYRRKMPNKPILCRLGKHQWETRHNEENVSYTVCARCGKDREKAHLLDRPGGL